MFLPPAWNLRVLPPPDVLFFTPKPYIGAILERLSVFINLSSLLKKVHWILLMDEESCLNNINFSVDQSLELADIEEASPEGIPLVQPPSLKQALDNFRALLVFIEFQEDTPERSSTS